MLHLVFFQSPKKIHYHMNYTAMFYISKVTINNFLKN